MSSFTREIPPDFIDPMLREYLDRMFGLVEVAVSNNDILPIRTDQLSKPKAGKLYYFKNASLTVPAISSAGYWGFVGEPDTGTWVKLG